MIQQTEQRFKERKTNREKFFLTIKTKHLQSKDYKSPSKITESN